MGDTVSTPQEGQAVGQGQGAKEGQVTQGKVALEAQAEFASPYDKQAGSLQVIPTFCYISYNAIGLKQYSINASGEASH